MTLKKLFSFFTDAVKKLSSSDLLLPNLSKPRDLPRRAAWKSVKNRISRAKSSDSLFNQENSSRALPLPRLGSTDFFHTVESQGFRIGKEMKSVHESSQSTSLINNRSDSFSNMSFSDKDSLREETSNPLYPSPVIGSSLLNPASKRTREEAASFEVKLSEKLKDLQKTVYNKQTELKQLKETVSQIMQILISSCFISTGNLINFQIATVNTDQLADEVKSLRQDKKLITGLVKEAHKEMARKDNSMRMVMNENKHLHNQLTSIKTELAKTSAAGKTSKMTFDFDKSVLKSRKAAGKRKPAEVIETPIVKEKVKVETLLSRSTKLLDELEFAESSSNEASSSLKISESGHFQLNVLGEVKSVGTQMMTTEETDHGQRERSMLLYAEEELTSWKMMLRDLLKMIERDDKVSFSYLK